MQRFDGRPVLTWWQGTISKHGFGLGEGQIYSSSYRHLATVRAGDGIAEDLHEFVLEPDGAALITAWKPLSCDLEGVGGPANGAVYDASFQEIDVRTGLVRYEWDSLDHVPLTDSYMPASGASVAWPYDWFHLNSIALAPSGGILISARSTWAVYELDRATGTVQWQLGGREPSFAMGPGTLTAWQHDAQPLGPDTVSLFDNGEPPSRLAHSRGLVVRIDPRTHTATLVIEHQDLDADLRRDAGRSRAPAGRQLVDRLGQRQRELGGQPGRQAALRGAHAARIGELPHAPLPLARRTARPAARGAAARRARLLARVRAGWNGATDVARWRLEAGPSPRRLRTIGSVPRSGFETRLTAPASAAVVRVVALDQHGRALAGSRALAAPLRLTRRLG